MTGRRERLSGSVRVEAGALVVAVVGWIDEATVEQFRTMINEAMAVGARCVVVDMAGGEFLDPSGPAVLLIAAERLRSTGARLAVRAAPAPFHPLFEREGLTEAGAIPRPATAAALLEGLAGVAAIPQAREVLDAALKLVVTMAQAVMKGADGASITLPRHGQLGTVAASNDVVLEMDHDQYDTGEGPCLDAATEGERFHIESLGKEARWPAFVPRARGRGIESILSTPLITAERPIGALNVYSRTIGAFAVHEKRWADQFAAEASAVVSAAPVDGSADVLSGQIQQALLSREVIALAQGVVMHRDSVSAETAYSTLAELSRRIGSPLRDICERLVSPGGDADPTGVPAEGDTHGPPAP